MPSESDALVAGLVQGTQVKVMCQSKDCREILGFVYFGAPHGIARFFCKCGYGAEVIGTPTGLIFRPTENKKKAG